VIQNLSQKDFMVQALPKIGVLSYILTGEGWLHLTTVIDLFSRKLAG
jgi:hypothetical protein